jgi:cytochrome b subunit of formate dehydrogenase
MQIFDPEPESPNDENQSKNDTYNGSGAIGIRNVAAFMIVLTVLSLITGIVLLVNKDMIGAYCIASAISCLISVPILRGFATVVEAAHIYKKKNEEK